MQEKRKDEQADKDLSKLVLQELKKNPYHEFNIAFALMTIIPFLVFLYILGSKFSNKVLIGNTGAVFFIAFTISLSGFLIGYQIVKSIISKVIEYAARVKHADSLKSDFVASVSHDLKSPLNTIKLSICNVLDGVVGEVNEKQKSTLQMCKEIIERTTHLVLELLDIYKFEAGMVRLERKACDFSGMLEKHLQEYQAQCEKNRISLHQKIARELKAEIDENRISQVINNLLSNAVKFTPAGGAITVTAFSADGFVRLEVVDNGPGIAHDKKDKIFDKFVRLEGRKEGTGLGLAIARDIVELHQGRIWVESSPGKGSEFIVVIPQVA